MLDAVFRILKVTAIIAVCAVFMVAINNLLFSFVNLVFHNVIGETFSLISMYLPFNASVVFGSIGVSVSAIFKHKTPF